MNANHFNKGRRSATPRRTILESNRGSDNRITRRRTAPYTSSRISSPASSTFIETYQRVDHDDGQDCRQTQIEQKECKDKYVQQRRPRQQRGNTLFAVTTDNNHDTQPFTRSSQHKPNREPLSSPHVHYQKRHNSMSRQQSHRVSSSSALSSSSTTKKRQSQQHMNIHRNSNYSNASITKEGKVAKSKSIKENAKKRHERMEETKRRRDQLDKKRLQHLQQNSGIQRQKRIKKRALEEKSMQHKVTKWIMIVTLGLRMQAALQLVKKFREYKAQLEIEDKAARIITRQMQIFKFRMYRKRVNGAFRILATIFLVKIRLWKQSRRRVASDRVTAFLLALERDNKDSGGCLALIVKGKKWRAYRLKIIILQRLWRHRLKMISSQVLLIDRQWQLEQRRRTDKEVETIYTQQEANVFGENEHIENINRTRRLLKMQPLPKKICDTRDQIRARLLKGVDLLSSGHIVPSEIRYGIIRDMLKHLRRLHLQQIELYEKAFQRYEKDTKDRQRRRALLVGFSGNEAVKTWAWGKRSTQPMNITEWDFNSVPELPPIKPQFHLTLGDTALSTLVKSGQRYVEDLRKLWNPHSMEVGAVQYDGKAAAQAHFNEHPKIISTNKRNKIFLSEYKK